MQYIPITGITTKIKPPIFSWLPLPMRLYLTHGRFVALLKRDAPA